MGGSCSQSAQRAAGLLGQARPRVWVLIARSPAAGPGTLATFMSGGFAGMANWAAMLPIDTVKSRYQIAPEGKYSGVYAVFREILAKEGVKGFYKGLTPVMVRAFPANAACFAGYETAAALLTKAGLE